MAVEKNSIKNLLFTRAIETFVIPYPINGHKLFGCVDCGDKFVLESSYDYHINRKSVKIQYNCKQCNITHIFFNRCKLLDHIRSHIFKTTTINLSDLKLDLLPITEYPMALPTVVENTSDQQTITCKKPIKCHECELPIDYSLNVSLKSARGKHYKRKRKTEYTCQICLYILPNECALSAHLRLHLKHRPYICPDCGQGLHPKFVSYPFNHNCEGMMMMRITTRILCPATTCEDKISLHPNDFDLHMTENHIKTVYKCPKCVTAGHNKESIEKHIKQKHDINYLPVIFHQCQLCPGRLVVDLCEHLNSHAIKTYVYPCWSCNKVFNNVFDLLKHPQSMCSQGKSNLIVGNLDMKENNLYQVIKKCNQCQSSSTHKCKYNEIDSLPNNCSGNCSAVALITSVIKHTEDDKQSCIKCPLCKIIILADWSEIKKHFFSFHKEHKCLDVSINLKRIISTKNRKRNNNENSEANQSSSIKHKKTIASDCEVIDEFHFHCVQCENKYQTKEDLENHLQVHRDSCAAYQCLECGRNFLVKRSFSTHLLIQHNISDAEDYIKSKKCYNIEAFNSYQIDCKNEKQVKKNQCNICLEQCINEEDLTKHFRVHGMAFLLKTRDNMKQNVLV